MVLKAVLPSSALVLVAGFALGGSARADVPPQPGYEETCTVERQQRPTENCQPCRDSYHGDRTACERRYEAAGYTFRCRTSGASVWTELWCRDGAAPDELPGAVPPTPPPVAPTTAPDANAPAAPADGSAAPAEGSVQPVAAVPTTAPTSAPTTQPSEPPAPAVPTAAAPAETPAPVDESRRGCASGGGSPSAFASMFSMLALLLARRRRS